MRLRDTGSDSQRRRRTERQSERRQENLHVPANGVTRDMVDKGSDRDAADQEKSEKGHKDKIMGRAATISKSCSTKYREETLRNLIFFLNDATDGTGRRQGTTAAG